MENGFRQLYYELTDIELDINFFLQKISILQISKCIHYVNQQFSKHGLPSKIDLSLSPYRQHSTKDEFIH